MNETNRLSDIPEENSTEESKTKSAKPLPPPKPAIKLNEKKVVVAPKPSNVKVKHIPAYTTV